MKKGGYFILILVTISLKAGTQCWQKTAAGYAHTLVIKTTGTLCGGAGNTFGHCGNAAPHNSIAAPLQIETDPV